MAQGVAWDKEKVTEVLRPYFQLGCSVTKACKYAGIAQTTVDEWIQNDDALRLKITGWQNEINAKARANWRAKVASGDYEPSKQWLEKNERDDFGIKTETDITTGGKAINTLEAIPPEALAEMRKIYEDAMKKKLTKGE